ncbi:hypothetical protein BC938DRAFT_471404 [Jimgerdemannia flammicorona]|uniref:Uncharacterized protein n=1 Tax=Jimgerdemannia flammicorona TaxID=994334 RepID=A0A433Q883_9FUNG|nr:hypothetical protein BC938DRAFT_471404 [Jimgerdemannia flammicorona]
MSICKPGQSLPFPSNLFQKHRGIPPFLPLPLDHVPHLRLSPVHPSVFPQRRPARLRHVGTRPGDRNSDTFGHTCGSTRLRRFPRRSGRRVRLVDSARGRRALRSGVLGRRHLVGRGG